MSYRKEVKFRVTPSESLALKYSLKNKGMSELFPEREINSLYFDTPQLLMLEESEEGSVPRKKVRVRWYHDDSMLTLEKKISSFEGRYKEAKSLTHAEFKALSAHGITEKDYGKLYPSLLVTYIREYFEWQNMRITFDKQIRYQNPRSVHSPTYKDYEQVIEIKTSMSVSDDYIAKHFPYPNKRFSKYSRGFLIQNKQLAY
jgi:hypothetical protein